MKSAPGTAITRGLDLSCLQTEEVLSSDKLPSYGAVIRYANYLRKNAEKKTLAYRDYTLAEDVAQEVLRIWYQCAAQFCSPVTYNLHSVTVKVQNLIRDSKAARSTLTGKTEKVLRLHERAPKLFDILKCK